MNLVLIDAIAKVVVLGTTIYAVMELVDWLSS